MPATLIALALLSLTQKRIPVEVDINPGQAISGIRQINVKLGDSKGIITQVEFYVNNELRDTCVSIPYGFKLDTVNEPEGTINLGFRAYSSEGETGEKDVSVQIDNQLDRGPEYHTKKALDALTNSDWADAILEARVAMKAKADYNPARMAMAQAYLGEDELDRAQKFAQDVVSSDANNAPAIRLLGEIAVRRAFAPQEAGAATGDADRTQSLFDSIANLHRIEHQELDAIPSDDSHLLQYVDLALKYGFNSLAIVKLISIVEADPGRTELANRLAYAQLREDRLADALHTLHALKAAGTADAYSYALDAVAWTAAGDVASSDAALRDAIANGVDEVEVLVAEADLNLRKGRKDVSDALIAKLQSDYSQIPQVQLLLANTLDAQSKFEEGQQHYVSALRMDPNCLDAYIEAGNVSMLLSLFGKDAPTDAQFRNAYSMFEVAHNIRPSSAAALTGMALADLLSKKLDDALKYSTAANDAAKTYAAGFYVKSAVLRALGRYEEAIDAANQAGKLDKQRLEGQEPPKPETAWIYFYRYGRPFVLMPPPAKN